jgi:hypothetical protein
MFYPMTNRPSNLLGASALLLAGLAAGCQSPSADTLLLKKDPGSSATYRAPGENDVPYATNVVHVPRDARFSLSLEAINPGWLHQKNVRKPNGGSSVSPFGCEPDFAGKDLWLLIHIRTLSANDSLQVESKQISRASIVKYDMRSFGLIPLTIDEVTPVSLEANSDYEVSIRLYEVKKDFLRSPLDKHSGLSGVARTAWATTTDTFNALVGDSATDALGRNTTSGLPIERHLLDAGGRLHFDARFAVYRSDDTLAPRHPDDDARGGVIVNRYQLVDPYNRRDTDHRNPRKDARYTGTAGYLEQLQNLENTEVPGRQDAFMRFRVESMWSPVARALAQIQASPAALENVSQEQALAAESLATTARETFLKVSEAEKQASLAAAEALRKSDSATSSQLEQTARALSRKTQEVAAARSAMETAQARALQARQAVEAASSREIQTANAEKTAALANAALVNARRATDTAVKELDAARDALQHTRETAEAARLKKEEWMQAEARAKRRLEDAREQFATLSRKAEKNQEDGALREKVTDAEREIADAAQAVETAASEWKLAQKDQEAKLNEVEDRIDAVAQKRHALAESEQEKQRARAAKDQADTILNGAQVTDPRPAILRARSL